MEWVDIGRFPGFCCDFMLDPENKLAMVFELRLVTGEPGAM
jgi:hypothetical protein